MHAVRERNPLRVLGALAVLCVALGSIGGSHYYLARRFVLDPGLPQPWALGLCVALAVLCVGMFAQPVLERRMRPPWLRLFSWPFVMWMGVLWIAVVLLALSDAAIGLMGAQGGADAAAARAAFVGFLVLGASAVALRNGLRVPAVRRVEIALPRWPRALDGFRIAQISDIHIGPVLGRRFASGLVERVNALGADLVAVTGDLVDGGAEQLRDDVEPFAALRARHGVFFVTGNHDVYSGAEDWVARARELGMRVLRNERVAIEGFDLAGVDDHRGDWVSGGTEDLEAALAGRDRARPVVLLAHDPTTWKRARAFDVDLQLSGHTHGGQIWPFHYLVRLVVPWIAGLHRAGPSALYVSRGSGFWGPPMRLLAPAEITEIVLRAGEAPPTA
jgi:hypothetical protein